MRLEGGHLGRFEVLADGEVVARRGGGLLARLAGGGWPDPDEVVAVLRARAAQEPST